MKFFLKKIHFNFCCCLLLFVYSYEYVKAEEVKKIETITTITEEQKIVENKVEEQQVNKKENKANIDKNIVVKNEDDDENNDIKEKQNKDDAVIKQINKEDKNLPVVEEERKINLKDNNKLPKLSAKNNIVEKPNKIEPTTLKNIEQQVIQQSQQQELNDKQEIEQKKQENTNKIIEEIKKEEAKEEEIEKKKEIENETEVKEEIDKKDDIKEGQKQDENNNDTKEVKKQENLTDDKKTNDKKKDKINDIKNNVNINIDKLFTTFDTKKALNFDYNKIKYDNFCLLENTEELKEIKKALKDQSDPNVIKKLEAEEKLKGELNNKLQAIAKPVENILQIYSLFYLNDNYWKAKVNRTKVDYATKDKKMFNGASIVKANKTSMIFLLQTPNKLVDKVLRIKEEQSSYSNNYYLVKDGKNTYIAFKLFIGQKIDLDTMKITG